MEWFLPELKREHHVWSWRHRQHADRTGVQSWVAEDRSGVGGLESSFENIGSEDVPGAGARVCEHQRVQGEMDQCTGVRQRGVHGRQWWTVEHVLDDDL